MFDVAILLQNGTFLLLGIEYIFIVNQFRVLQLHTIAEQGIIVRGEYEMKKCSEKSNAL